LWPNFCGFEEAPATAMRGEDMNVRAAVCMFVVLGVVVVVVLSVVVVVLEVDFRRFCDLVVAGISGWEFGFCLLSRSGWVMLFRWFACIYCGLVADSCAGLDCWLMLNGGWQTR
jgi:hypothetical protein